MCVRRLGLLMLPPPSWVSVSNLIRLSGPHLAICSMYSNSGIHITGCPICRVRWRKSASKTKCCLDGGLGFENLLTWGREASEGERSSQEELQPPAGLNLQVNR